MYISDDLLRYLEDLSRLSLSPEEKEAVKQDLSALLGYLETLDRAAIPVAGADSFASPSAPSPFPQEPLGCTLREDHVLPSTDREALLQNAPDQNRGYLRVPSAIE